MPGRRHHRLAARARLAAWGLALALVAEFACAQAAPIQIGHKLYGAGVSAIPVTAYSDGGSGLHPAVFLLYGARGPQVDGAMYRVYARALALAGDDVYVVDYYARTQSVPGATPQALGAALAANLGAWVKGVREVISAVSDEPGVDASRLGLLGFSQGAYLAIAVAAADPDVGAVVEFYGGVPPVLRGRLGPLPPTLILHGDADRVVPVSEAHRLADALSASGSRYDIVIYPNAGHRFNARLTSADGRDALRRTLRFFKDNL
ncbi:MAG TPA: dienelactone hydrolase family protein [Burkholderiales bacterium]|nr:dienelactone hydrolase family protein [Burkholderiales bacterium]